MGLNLPTYNGDVSSYLGKQLGGGDQAQLNQQFGYDPARSNYDFQANGNIYTVSNNNNGTRSVSQSDTVANRLGKQQQQQAADLAAKQKTALDTQFANDKTEVNNFTNDFQNATTGAVQGAYSEFGIPQQVGAVNALKGRIADLGLNLSGAGAGGYANNDQVDKAVNTSYLPNLSLATNALGASTSAAQTQIQTQLQPYLSQAQLLGTRIASEMTGFTAQQKNELDAALTAMNNGATLTNSQLQRMNDLAIAEEQYSTMAQGYTDQLMASLYGNQYRVVGPGDSLVNVNNGQSVAGNTAGLDLGSSGSSGGGYTYDTSGNSAPTTSTPTTTTSTPSPSATFNNTSSGTSYSPWLFTLPGTNLNINGNNNNNNTGLGIGTTNINSNSTGTNLHGIGQ